MLKLEDVKVGDVLVYDDVEPYEYEVPSIKGDVLIVQFDNNLGWRGGHIRAGELHRYTLKPKRIEGWLNVYDCGFIGLYQAKKDADQLAMKDRLACIKISYTEGEGL